jgi:hypothetical protein
MRTMRRRRRSRRSRRSRGLLDPKLAKTLVSIVCCANALY